MYLIGRRHDISLINIYLVYENLHLLHGSPPIRALACLTTKSDEAISTTDMFLLEKGKDVCRQRLGTWVKGMHE